MAVALERFVVGRVLERHRHPDADRHGLAGPAR
jgi:hypothetical protein